MKILYRWEKVLILIIAFVSFIAGFSNGLIDAIMALAINTLIIFVLLILGNKIFRKKKVINSRSRV